MRAGAGAEPWGEAAAQAAAAGAEAARWTPAAAASAEARLADRAEAAGSSDQDRLTEHRVKSEAAAAAPEQADQAAGSSDRDQPTDRHAEPATAAAAAPAEEADRARARTAAAAYRRNEQGVHEAFALVVLTTTPTGIARITLFSDLRLFPTFGFPTIQVPDVRE